MPVKISTRTDSNSGEITQEDLGIMKTHFEDGVILNPINGSPTVIKKIAWYLTREEVEKLFVLNRKDNIEPTILEINFAVHLNQPNLCDGSSLLNCLTFVLQVKDQNHNPVNSDEEYVLIPGYNTFTKEEITIKNLHGVICCPSSKPPPTPPRN